MSTNSKNRPFCKCHNLLMASKGKNAWRCRLKQRKRSLKYDKSIKGYIRKRRYELKLMRSKIIKQMEDLNVR